MAHTVELVKDLKYVRLVFTDEVTNKDQVNGRAEAVHALAASGWNKLLVDATEIDVKVSFMDDFKFTTDHQSSHPPTARIAVISPKKRGFFSYSPMGTIKM